MDTWIGISQIASATAIVLGVIYAGIQLRIVAKQRQLEALAKVFSELRDSSFLESFWFIHLGEKVEWSELNNEEKIRIIGLVYNYQRMALLIEKGLLCEDDIMDLWGSAILKSWKKLDAFVHAVRENTEFDDFGAHFERLSKKCKAHFNIHT